MTVGFPRVPGLANVHSHAFQRLLRGHVQQAAPDRDDTFWTWREAMYGLANRMDLGALEAAARLTYVECLEAGYTAVGEFHYLHHGPDGAPWPDPVAASRVMLRAARQAGIRVTLLWTVYARGGLDTPLSPRQARFGVQTLDDVWRAIDALAGDVDGERTALGLAIHSVRAVPRSWMRPLAEGARARGLQVHGHVSEQRDEVTRCKAATGLSPVGLLADEGVLDPHFTAVHATWLDDADVTLLASSGATVCLCPTTEGDLGDGVPRTDALIAHDVPLCVGSDSHAVIDPFAELRTLEYQARAATGRRCVVTDPDGQVAPALWRIGADQGYHALGLDPGDDHIVLDEEARAFEGGASSLATAVTAGHPGLVREVVVAGDRVVVDGRWAGR